MAYVEWPGYQGSRFPAEVRPIVECRANGDEFEAYVYCPGCAPVFVDRYRDLARARADGQAFCERVEAALSEPTGRRCRDCGRIVEGVGRFGAWLQPDGSLLCVACDKAAHDEALRRVQGDVREVATNG